VVRRIAGAISPQVIVHDELVNWMQMTIPGWLDPGHLFLLGQALDDLPSDGPILEIGSYWGLSTNTIRRVLDKRGLSNDLWSCDPWHFGLDGQIDTSALTFDEIRVFVREGFITATNFFSAHNLPHTVAARSDEFFLAWSRGQSMTDVFGRTATPSGPFTLCYIDGEHTTKAVRADFEACDAMLEIGGFILFDDSAEGGEYPIGQFARKIVRTGRYELAGRNPNYLIRKLV
jgi:hypothetical protein